MRDDSEQHKARIARYYGRLAPGYDRLGPRVMALEGRQLVELAQVHAGSTVLDVATGRGAVLLAAAERAGPEGCVLGIDLAPEMVEAASADLRALGLAQAAVRRMDAEALDLPDAAFDYVLCAYGLFFFPHLPRALAEFRRVLKPGGRFGATTDAQGDERWAWLAPLLEAYGAEPNPLVQTLADPGTLAALLGEAGLVEIAVSERQNEVVYASPAEWWASRELELAARLPPTALPRFKAAALARLAAQAEPGGLRRLSGVRFHLARKPPAPA